MMDVHEMHIFVLNLTAILFGCPEIVRQRGVNIFEAASVRFKLGSLVQESSWPPHSRIRNKRIV